MLNLKPTPQELTYWMANADEIDKRVEGTELAAMIDKGGANQRSGVLGSLNMVADASRMAYVSVSRAKFDVQMYTDDIKALGKQLSRDVSKLSALQQTNDPKNQQQQMPLQDPREEALTIKSQSVGMELSQGLSLRSS